MADLIDALGDIPPGRIRFYSPPGTATVSDAVAAESRGWGLCELVDGVLVEKATGLYESAVAMWLVFYLLEHVKRTKTGVVSGEAGMFRVTGGRSRMPDVAFTTWSGLPADLKSVAAPSVSPDLAVEVISAGNTEREIEQKRNEYFAGGTRLVWVVRPVPRAVDVFTPDSDKPTTLSTSDQLDGGAVLPGFSLSIGSLFDEAEQSGARPVKE